MFVPIVLVGLGAALASRNRPKTTVSKLKAFGPRTGLEYQVEKLPEANVCIVRVRGGYMAMRREDGKWWHLRSKGHPKALKAITVDFDVQRKPEPEPEPLEPDN